MITPVLLALALLAGLACWRLQLGIATWILLVLSLTLAQYHLIHTDWHFFAHDAETHLDYIETIVRLGAVPEPGKIPVLRHPPGYYLLAAQVYEHAAAEGRDQAIAAVRQLSIVFYGIFLFFSALALRQALGKSLPYLASLLLVACWPAGATIGARITCDIPMYAATAAGLFFLIRWLEAFNHRWLAWAIVNVGFALLAKNLIVFWIPMLLLYTAYQVQRGAFTWASLKRRDIVCALLFLAFCLIVTFGRSWIFSYLPVFKWDWQLNSEFSFLNWRSLGYSFTYFFTSSIFDVTKPDGQYLFWNIFLRTLLLDQFLWKSDTLVLTLGLLMHGLLAYTVLTLLFSYIKPTTPAQRRIIVLLLWMFAVMIAALMFMRIRTGGAFYANARYIYVAVTMLALFFGLALQYNVQRKQHLLAATGVVLVVVFSLSSILLLLTQHGAFA